MSFINDLLSVITKMKTGLCGEFLLYSQTELHLLIHKMLKHFDKRSELILAYNFQHLICCVSTLALFMWLGQMNELNDMSKCAGCNPGSPGPSTGLFSSSSDRKAFQALNIFITNPVFTCWAFPPSVQLLLTMNTWLFTSCFQSSSKCVHSTPSSELQLEFAPRSLCTSSVRRYR